MTAAVKSKKVDSLVLPTAAGLSLPGAGQDWLDKLRATAAQNFANQGLPTFAA